jgi:hypothetical protein
MEEIGGNEGGNESGSKATQAKTKRAAVQLRRPLFRERLGRMERLRTTSAAVTGTTDQLWRESRKTDDGRNSQAEENKREKCRK